MQTVTIVLSGYFTDGYPVMGQFASEPNTYDVPPGQNLVIESMSAFAGVPKGQSANLWLDVTDGKRGDIVAKYYIPLVYQATFSTNPTNPNEPVRDWRTMNHALRAYIPGGSRIHFEGAPGPESNCRGGEASPHLRIRDDHPNFLVAFVYHLPYSIR